MKETIKNAVFTAVIAASLCFCIKFPWDIAESVTLSMQRCIDVIIPSMFLFMYITSIAVSAGMHTFIGKLSGPVSTKIFRLKNEHFGIFLLSLFSGYPAGIKLLTDLYHREKLTESEFERLSCFCFAGGPAFISGTVSGILFPETSAGTLCFVSITTGNIITALAGSFFSEKIMCRKIRTKIKISAETLTQPALSSAKAIFQMCVMITAFGGLFRIAELTGMINKISEFTAYLTGTDIATSQTITSSFFEISNIVNLPSNSPELLPIISALLSFGGLCVLAQVIVISDGLINIRCFLSARLFAAIMSALICRLISRFFYLGTADAFSEIKIHSDAKIIPTVFLIIMTFMVLSLSKSYRQSD